MLASVLCRISLNKKRQRKLLPKKQILQIEQSEKHQSVDYRRRLWALSITLRKYVGRIWVWLSRHGANTGTGYQPVSCNIGVSYRYAWGRRSKMTTFARFDYGRDFHSSNVKFRLHFLSARQSRHSTGQWNASIWKRTRTARLYRKLFEQFDKL